METSYAYTRDMNDELVEKCNNQTFTQGSAILKIKYFSLEKLIVQHPLIKEQVKKMEVNRMRTGYIVDVLTSVDFQKFFKNEDKVLGTYEGIVYRKYFSVSPF